MKRKFLTTLVIVGALFLTACQEDDTMDELIQDANSTSFDVSSSTLKDNGDGGDGDVPPGGN